MSSASVRYCENSDGRALGRRVSAIAAAFALQVLAACNRPLYVPAEASLYEFKMSEGRGQVFDASLRVAQRLNLNVAVLEKASGLLRFESATLSPVQLDEYCSYPVVGSRTGRPVDTFAGWNTRAHGLVRGGVSLTVLLSDADGGTSANIRGNWTAYGPGEALIVNSKRVLEAQFQQALLQELASHDVKPASRPAATRLEDLQRLRDSGLISPADYDRKRAEIIREL